MKQSPLFSNIQTGDVVYDDVERATYKGITIKTCILLLITIVVAAITAFALPKIILEGNYTTFYVTLAISSVVGFISVIVGRMSERKAKYASVIYAFCQGLFLGNLCAIAELFVPGVVTVAIFSTVVLFAVMLILFATGIIRVGSKLRSICYGLTIGALALILLVSILSLFVDYGSYMGIMIGVEAFLLFYGVITLSLNFAEANNVVERGASKGAEWSVSLGLMVSIIYIFVEIVRLLILVAARNDN